MATPDFAEPDLKSAVSFILDQYPRLSALCDELADGLSARGLVFIGGLSRSGKTTLANALKLALEARGRGVTVLALDRWLRNADERSAGVLGRYDMEEVARLAGMLRDRRRPLDMELPFYDRLNRRQIAGAERITLAPEDVVIFEGTIALYLREQLGVPSLGCFVEADERLRHDRVLREYRSRGLGADEAEAIYRARQADEIPIIFSNMGKPDRRFTMPLPPVQPNPVSPLRA